MQQLLLLSLLALPLPVLAEDFKVQDSETLLEITTPELQAAFNKKGYVTGVYRESFVDRKTGFKDAGFGLDIIDWIMEPGSDEAYRDQLDPELIYRFNNEYHGKRPKRSIEGPQICTQAKAMQPETIQGRDFLAVKQTYQYQTAAPGKKTGSVWTQWIVFPKGKRYFISMDRMDVVNDSEAMFFRMDMPGHIRHNQGDTFEKIYLSYHGEIPAKEFFTNFAPEEKFHYLRGQNELPERIIRGYKLRDPQTGQSGPWLAGMTLNPESTYEAWCHQRGYVCMIQEIGGKPVKAGESISAAFIVGYFDSIEEMNQVYDAHKGYTGLEVTKEGWKLTK